MPGLPENEKSRVTLERLLQLKRSERPDAAFWDGFDRELRQRQLAALVTIRPWHDRVLRMGMMLLRRCAPVGAVAAAVAAGYVVWDMRDAALADSPTIAIAAEEPAIVLPAAEFEWTRTVKVRDFVLAPSAQLQPRYLVRQFSTRQEPNSSFNVDASPVVFSVSAVVLSGQALASSAEGL
jgi:hypothetical protein